jgi:hypothetical protein
VSKRIALRKKNKEKKDQDAAPKHGSFGKPRPPPQMAGEDDAKPMPLLDRMKSVKQPPPELMSPERRQQTMRDMSTSVMRTRDETVAEDDNESEGTVEDDSELEDLMDEMERKDIRFKELWTSAESLVLAYLPDSHLSQATDRKDKKGDIWEKAFRWKNDALADDKFKPVECQDDFEGIEGRDDGVVPSSFDVQAYQKHRAASPFYEVMPARLRRARLAEPVESVPPEACISSMLQLRGAPNPQAIRIIHIDEKVALSKKAEAEFLNSLNRFSRCEILVLRHLGLKHVDQLRLPRLLAADFVNNKITDFKVLQAFATHCPLLYQLDTRNNPIANRNIQQQLVAVAHSLRWYNAHTLSDQERLQAVNKYGTDAAKRMQRAMDVWESALLRIPNVVQMQRWAPHTLKHVKLSNLGLDRIFVGSMTELVTLDVSHNNITTIQTSGLERLSKLMAFNVSRNKLLTADLQVLQWIPNLRVVMLAHNNLPEDYRFRTLWICRNLKWVLCCSTRVVRVVCG